MGKLVDVLVILVVFCVVTQRWEVQAEEYWTDAIKPVRFDADPLNRRDARIAVSANTVLECERPEFYTCEEPPDAIPVESTKECDYRNWRYHEQIFRWVAGRGCLLFTPDFLYKDGANPFNLNSACYYGHLFAPCLEVVKEDGTCACYPFDPNFEEVTSAIRDALIAAAQNRWQRCYNEAANCCSHAMSSNYTVQEVSDTIAPVTQWENEANYCGATFDAWTCWEATPAGTVVSEICPEFAYSYTAPTCNHFSSKECFENGTWALQTDYSTCSITPRFLRRYHFHIGMLAFSIASCLPAVFVFFFYKRLRVTRVALHRNLLIAIIIRNVLVIISRSEIYIDEISNDGDTVMSRHPVWCRVLAVLERMAGNAVFVCMLVEGIYLHRLIVAAFRKKLNIKILNSIGVVISIAPVIAWSVVMAKSNDHTCWLYYTIEDIQWILDAPRLCILVVNTFLFLDVLRVLLTKIRNSENANQLNTTKATLFLMPIFGTQFLLTAFRPNTTSCVAEEAYYFVTYTLEGLQGFIVAMLYCYINKEVHMLVKATYKKTENAVVSRVRRDSNYRRTTLGFPSDRRITYSTALDPKQMDETDKDEYNDIRPKLHVAEIISIQHSEKLADILEPVYEVIESGADNQGFKVSESDNHQLRARPVIDDYSKSSSVADARDWIRCISSPTSSVYENSLNDYEVHYLERKFPDHIMGSDTKLSYPSRHSREDMENNYLFMAAPLRNFAERTIIDNASDIRSNNNTPSLNNSSNSEDKNTHQNDGVADTENYDDITNNSNNDNDPSFNKEVTNETISLGDEDNIDREESNDMVQEIMEYFDANEIFLDSRILSPNRNEEDQIIFI